MELKNPGIDEAREKPLTLASAASIPIRKDSNHKIGSHQRAAGGAW